MKESRWIDVTEMGSLYEVRMDIDGDRFEHRRRSATTCTTGGPELPWHPGLPPPPAARRNGKRGALLLSLGILTGGCAQTPDNIQPTYVAPATYAGKDCAALTAERDTLHTQLVLAERQQESAAADDAMGVLILGLPLGSMQGKDQAPKIASLKGNLQAIASQAATTGCTLPAPPAVPEPEKKPAPAAATGAKPE